MKTLWKTPRRIIETLQLFWSRCGLKCIPFAAKWFIYKTNQKKKKQSLTLKARHWDDGTFLLGHGVRLLSCPLGILSCVAWEVAVMWGINWRSIVGLWAAGHLMWVAFQEATPRRNTVNVPSLPAQGPGRCARLCVDADFGRRALHNAVVFWLHKEASHPTLPSGKLQTTYLLTNAFCGSGTFEGAIIKKGITVAWLFEAVNSTFWTRFCELHV